jgi:hypothetical protein
MKARGIVLGLAFAAALALSGCGDSRGERAVTGGLIGGGGGYLLGGTTGAVVGGVAGAGIGAATGD